MTDIQVRLIIALLIASVVFLLIPIFLILIFKLGRLFTRSKSRSRKTTGFIRMMVFFVCLIISVWCLRYAVGYYTVISNASEEISLSWQEEILNSFTHVLQTFSMDEDYTEYIISGKSMLRDIFGEDNGWQSAYGIYSAFLNLISPIAGGAVIFEILASIFPIFKLRFSYLMIWKDKYFFSELNERSLELARSIFSENRSKFFRQPILVFTDVYTNGEELKEELLQNAKQVGAICVRDDLVHLPKNRFGNKTYFLIDENESDNLQALVDLANRYNGKYLKYSEIYLFSQDEIYTQLELRVRDKLKKLGFDEKNGMPTFIPVQRYRNLITRLLVELPLYEPLIGRVKNADGTRNLNVTIVGSGDIGTEMFLSTYWFGQMLDCKLHINVVSRMDEAAFWGKIDHINPEIRKSMNEKDQILEYNKMGDRSEPYCSAIYHQCDVKSSEFVSMLTGESTPILDTDYFLVALGSDEANLSAAEEIRRMVGKHHLENASDKRTVIAYVIYNNKLAETLNMQKHYRSNLKDADIYMRAVGSLSEIYSLQTIDLLEYEQDALETHSNHVSAQEREARASIHKSRITNDYDHWASRARVMHRSYKAFSLDLFELSVFDVDSVEDERYIGEKARVREMYDNFRFGNIDLTDKETRDKHIQKLHLMAWLEHRRWCAFTRVRGYMGTDKYENYIENGEDGPYKQMSLKLHPCLRECDKKGIRGVIDEKGEVDESTLFKCHDESELDLLDILSYKLVEGGYHRTGFKITDYPIYETKRKEETEMKNAKKYIDSFRIKHESFLTGCDSIEEMGLWDKETLGEMDAFYSNDLASIIIRLIAVDGKITQKEVDYLNRTFDFDYTLEALVGVYESCRDEIGHSFDESFQNGISHMRKINPKLADAYKELLALICKIIIESDGIISSEEAVEVEKLKSLCE